MGDIDATQERNRQREARNYFSPAVGGDNEALTEMAQRDPQMAKIALELRDRINTQNDPKALHFADRQMRVARAITVAAKKNPQLWPKVQNTLSQWVGYDVGGVENADDYIAMFSATSNEANARLKEVQSSTQLPGGITQIVRKGGETEVVYPTDEEKAAIEAAEERGVTLQQRRAKGRSLGGSAGKLVDKAIDRMGKLRENNLKLKSVIAEVEAGAETGVIAKNLPSFRASTLRLEQLQRELGLDVVGSVTFGALSEGELKLALDKGLPIGLDGPDLVQWAKEKISAQEKLANYLEEQAVFLSKPNTTVADWMTYIQSNKQPTTEGTNGNILNVGGYTVEVEQ
jgi:hypothetical protein